MLEVTNVTRRFGATFALRGVSFALPTGAVLAVFGPNGAGKSTLLKVLAGLLRADSGEVRLAGVAFARSDPAQRRRIGLISHASLCYDGLTALENLAFYARMYRLPSPADAARAALGDVGLLDRFDTMASAMSRGMLQRLAIARALLHDPELMLLDEPFTGLDQKSAADFAAQLARLKAGGRTMVLVTHNSAEALGLASFVANMEAGRFTGFSAR